MNFFFHAIFTLFLIPNLLFSELKIIDQICAIISDKEAILLSDIKTRSLQKNITKNDAFNELLEEAGLWHYAHKQLKFGDLKQIRDAAANNLKSFKEKNNLSDKDFSQAPYFTTEKRFEKQYAFMMLKNQIESHIYNKIKISDEQIKKAMASQFQIVFISLKGFSKNDLDKAFKSIRDNIKQGKKLDELKTIYEKNPKISFSDPMDYKKGDLKELYEKNLKINEDEEITRPFLDKNKMIMIWKINKMKTALEDLKKQIYEEEVSRELLRISSLPNKEFILVNNCGGNP